MPLKTRKPTGKPVWPMLLVAGGEKTGKTYTAAQASTSDHIGRTFWFAFGEDEPDEYGVMPGCRIEIVEHDGTIPGLIAGIEAAKAEPAVDGKPNLIVLDSATRLWNFLSDTAQHEADARARNKAQRYGNSRNLRPDGDNDIGMDLWNKAKTRHARVVEALRTHQGPVIVTARMETVTVMDGQGKPTKDKDVKIQSEKTLPYDVGAIVRIPERGEYQLTGVRSLRLPDQGGKPMPAPGFTVEALWEQLGLFDGETGQRVQEHLDAAGAQEKVAAQRARILAELQQVCASEERMQRLDEWWFGSRGERMHETEDLSGLQKALDGVKRKAAEAAAQQQSNEQQSSNEQMGEAA